ncbi:MAG: serine protease, partial [Isosphaeraceae bacterium]
MSPDGVVAALEAAVSNAIERAEQSVVAISRYKSGDGKTLTIRNPDDPRLRRESILLPQQLDQNDPNAVSYDYGSGVVIGDRGEILTAFHVVKGAARLEIRAPKVNQFHAEILAADPRTDLA